MDLDAVNLAVAVPRNRERLEHVQSTWALTHRRRRRLVDHRKDADAAVIQCVLHRVLVGVLAQSVQQPDMDPHLILLVLVIAVRAGVTPVVNLGLVPANTVAIRAVVRAKRDNVHREVLPDALTQGQVGHGPVIQGISLDILLDQGGNRLLVGLVRVDQAVLEVLIILDVAPELTLKLTQVEDIIKHDRHFWKGKELGKKDVGKKEWIYQKLYPHQNIKIQSMFQFFGPCSGLSLPVYKKVLILSPSKEFV